MRIFSDRATRAAGFGRDTLGEYGRRRRFVHRAGALMIITLAFLIGPLTGREIMARPLKLVALGDSLTAGYMLPAKDAFPVVLENALRAGGLNVQVVNAGVSGDTASDALERLEWALDADTDAAIVEVGANDMLRGIDPAITRKAIATILSKLKERNVKPIIAGMVAAPGMGSEFETKFNAIFVDLAREYGAPLYPFFLLGVNGDASMTLPDGLHPNPAGVRVIVAGILPLVKSLLEGIGASK